VKRSPLYTPCASKLRPFPRRRIRKAAVYVTCSPAACLIWRTAFTVQLLISLCAACWTKHGMTLCKLKASNWHGTWTPSVRPAPIAASFSIIIMLKLPCNGVISRPTRETHAAGLPPLTRAHKWGDCSALSSGRVRWLMA